MVSLLNAAKNVIAGKSPFDDAMGLPAPDKRIDRIDQCKVIWYQWKNELSTNVQSIGPVYAPTPSPLLAAARSYDISNHIESYTFSKNMANGAGSFSLTLQNSFDWPRWMRPGQWLCVYLTGNGDLPMPAESTGSQSTTGFIGSFGSAIAAGPPVPSLLGGTFKPMPELPLPKGPFEASFGPPQQNKWKPKLRCMGIIQRVAIKSMTNVDGVVETVYTITGKDFGTIYEETELWFNASNADGATFSNAIHAIAQQFTRNLTDLLNKWHDIFLSPANELSTSITSVKSFFPVQWVLPDQMVKDLELDLNPLGSGTFGDIKGVKEFNATVFENPDPMPLAGLQGHCWDRLKTLSQPEFHELFTELSDAGNPKLIFRPIPWANKKDNYPTIGALMLSYKDLGKLDGALPALGLGVNVGTFKSLSSFTAALGQITKAALPSDARTQHAVPISSPEVESFDLGPDYHARSNFFLVDAMQHSMAQLNTFALTAKQFDTPWPIRDEADIKRHGFRPKFINVNTFTLSNGQLFGGVGDIGFMKELNFLMKDFWADAEDYYSGTMELAAGRNDVKLGKVITTDTSFKGINEMMFYIEGYSDNFSVNADGTCAWTQSLNLTRGVQKSVLLGGSTKDQQASEPSTFHVNTGSSDSAGGLLGQIKNGIKDPKSLF